MGSQTLSKQVLYGRFIDQFQVELATFPKQRVLQLEYKLKLQKRRET